MAEGRVSTQPGASADVTAEERVSTQPGASADVTVEGEEEWEDDGYEYDYLLSPFDDDNLGTVILEHCDAHTLANIVPRVCVRWRWPVLFSDQL
jgi:hypothetical protein